MKYTDMIMKLKSWCAGVLYSFPSILIPAQCHDADTMLQQLRMLYPQSDVHLKYASRLQVDSLRKKSGMMNDVHIIDS